MLEIEKPIPLALQQFFDILLTAQQQIERLQLCGHFFLRRRLRALAILRQHQCVLDVGLGALASTLRPAPYLQGVNLRDFPTPAIGEEEETCLIACGGFDNQMDSLCAFSFAQRLDSLAKLVIASRSVSIMFDLSRRPFAPGYAIKAGLRNIHTNVEDVHVYLLY